LRNLTDDERNSILREALKWVGVPYLLHGSDRAGIDCSHFVAAVYKNALKINLTPKADWLFLTSSIISLKQSKPGDLVFFCREPRPVCRVATHVAIYYFRNTVIHASYKKGGVAIEPIENIPGLITEKKDDYLSAWIKEISRI